MDFHCESLAPTTSLRSLPARCGARVVGALVGAACAGAALLLLDATSGVSLGPLGAALILVAALLGQGPIARLLLAPGRPESWLPWLMVFQLAAAVVVLAVPFGFDHPSDWGLDFGHLLILLVLYVAAFLTGIAAAVGSRSWRSLAAQVMLPAAILALVASGRLAL